MQKILLWFKWFKREIQISLVGLFHDVASLDLTFLTSLSDSSPAHLPPVTQATLPSCEHTPTSRALYLALPPPVTPSFHFIFGSAQIPPYQRSLPWLKVSLCSICCHLSTCVYHLHPLLCELGERRDWLCSCCIPRTWHLTGTHLPNETGIKNYRSSVTKFWGESENYSQSCFPLEQFAFEHHRQ